MVYFNETGYIGTLIYYATINITGSLFLTLLSMLFIILALFAMFKLPLEFTAILVFPLLLVLMAYQSDFLSIGAVFIIYIAILIAKNILFK